MSGLVTNVNFTAQKRSEKSVIFAGSPMKSEKNDKESSVFSFLPHSKDTNEIKLFDSSQRKISNDEGKIQPKTKRSGTQLLGNIKDTNYKNDKKVGLVPSNLGFEFMKDLIDFEKEGINFNELKIEKVPTINSNYKK